MSLYGDRRGSLAARFEARAADAGGASSRNAFSMGRLIRRAWALAALGLAAAAAAQDGAPDDAPGWTGLTEADEIIEARRVLMIQAEELMRPIAAFADGADADGAELRAAAATIEAMLLALPHLFPPTTNRYDPGTLEPPTRALPGIWRDFAAFRAMAAAGEEAAAAVVEASDEPTLRAAASRLRATCDGCHARFAKPYTPPQVTDEDRAFDFDSVFPDD